MHVARFFTSSQREREREREKEREGHLIQNAKQHPAIVPYGVVLPSWDYKVVEILFVCIIQQLAGEPCNSVHCDKLSPSHKTVPQNSASRYSYYSQQKHCAPDSVTRPGFEPMTSRSCQYITCH